MNQRGCFLKCLDIGGSNHYLVIFLQDFLAGSGGDQADDHSQDQAYQEARKQFVDVKNAAQGTHEELPDKDGSAAADHAGQSAPAIAALPEQSAENHGSKGSAETSPGEGDDFEDRGVGILCDENGNGGDDQQGNPGHHHGRFLTDVQVEHTVENVFGDGGGGSQHLTVTGGHGAG